MPSQAFVCVELAPMTAGYTHCKTWAVYEHKTWVDELAITKTQMVQIGGSITGALAVVLAYVIVAKALKSL